mmetsp:Transcript_1283/g.3063  ORF Transcript_1283/g.3063 Transcript_1283/m.3063 type:complete len:676 (-) Transcript_1283:721-2748(-)
MSELTAGRGGRSSRKASIAEEDGEEESPFDIYDNTFDMLVSQLEDEDLGHNLSSIFTEVLNLLKKERARSVRLSGALQGILNNTVAVADELGLQYGESMPEECVSRTPARRRPHHRTVHSDEDTPTPGTNSPGPSPLSTNSTSALPPGIPLRRGESSSAIDHRIESPTRALRPTSSASALISSVSSPSVQSSHSSSFADTEDGRRPPPRPARPSSTMGPSMARSASALSNEIDNSSSTETSTNDGVIGKSVAAAITGSWGPAPRLPRGRPVSALGSRNNSPAPSSRSHTVVDRPPSAEDLLAKERKMKVIDELISTEEAYLRDLDIIMDHVSQPLQRLSSSALNDRSSPDYLDPHDIEVVISNLPEVLEASQALYQDLKRSQELHQGNVGNAFVVHAPKLLKAYTRYVSDNAMQFDTIEKLRKNDTFQAFEKEFKRKPAARHLDLDSFLIQPVQRICKYPLLIKELQADTSPHDRDFAALEKAGQVMVSVTNDVNELKRFSENLKRMMEIQKKITGSMDFQLIDSARWFVKEGTFVKVSKGKAQTRHFYLFNDVLVYCRIHKDTKHNETRFHYAGRVMLKAALIRDLPDTSTRQNQLELVRIDKKRKPYIIVMGTPSQKKDWLSKLIDLIAIQMGGEAPSRKTGGSATDVAKQRAAYRLSTRLSPAQSHPSSSFR